ncbi:hypothetical protein ANCDUO_21928 [Ancylostoma duodenale]|uniref:Reverse transcriptase RNase H-like domain-containing protein n=1 Tax=Ancylostoma duodenale TaxID=51022 RepID=A0A0C2FSY7_9BILA|nr:hypothetical protein ANCDUO_21928 [Ancylostoma duodenale]
MGCVISHRYADGSSKPIAHASRSLTTAKKNYSQIEKEALGIVFAVEKFHKYVFGRKFLLLTEHKPLLAIFGDKKEVSVHSANRLMRWATILLGYDFDIDYVNTTKFGQADGSSRLMRKHQVGNEDIVVAAVENDKRRKTLSVVGGCLMSGERVVIPPELRSKVLKELHIGHPGIVRMKS